jgi:hypothetical protein
MSTQTNQRLSLLDVDFDELYGRHLGRHSQFGINVTHLAALYGLWFGLYEALYQGVLPLGLQTARVVILTMAVVYVALVAINAPVRVSLATAAFMAFFVASVVAVPSLPGWSILAFVAMIPAFYKIQAWSHKIWNVAEDMSQFNKRFPPGRTLASILLIYEVPICLHYLMFMRKDWRA